MATGKKTLPSKTLDSAFDPTSEMDSFGVVILNKRERLGLVLEILAARPACHSGLEAYRQISDALNLVEDEHLGPNNWCPPRSFVGQPTSERMYPTYPESMIQVTGYGGNTALLHETEVIVVSRFGAMEVRRRNGRVFVEMAQELAAPVVFEKPDAYGDGVWHEKNQT